jgi:hypothetical protein
MHRSGTSAVARVVNLLGVDLGPSHELMGAKPDNPDGFWESKGIVALNDDLLARLGGRWDDPPLPYKLASLEDASAFRERATAILAAFERDRLGFKDPRASVLMDFWRDIWPDARVIVCLRHPVAVAASLRKRDEFDDEKSAALWTRYTWDALGGSTDPVMVMFDQLLQDPEGTVWMLAEAIDLAPTESDVARAIASIRTDRPREPQSTDERMGAMTALAVELYQLLSEGLPPHIDVIAAGVREPATVARLREAEEQVKTIHRMADLFHEELTQAQGAFAAATEEADRSRALAEARQTALEREERAREALTVKVTDQAGELERLRSELAWRRALQYRLEKVLGRRGLIFLSGYRGEN